MAAAAMVAISHIRDVIVTDYAGQPFYAPFYAITGFGHSGVIVFFVLSGFWISRSVLRQLGNDDFWTSYLIDRLSRLEIVLLPALILGGLFDWVGMYAANLSIYSGAAGPHSIQAAVADRLSLPSFLGNLVFLQTIAVPTFGSNGPLWSLANEFWYYVWFPALAMLFRCRRPTWALLTLGIGIANPGIALGFLSWLVGFLLLLQLERSGVEGSAQSGQRGVRFFAAMFVFVAVLGASGLYDGLPLDLPLAAAFGWFLYELARARIPFPRLLLPLARFGGGASFSLYVIHFPLIALVGGLITKHGRLAPGPATLALVMGLLLLCMAAAWLFSRFTEAKTGLLRSMLRARLLRPEPAR